MKMKKICMLFIPIMFLLAVLNSCHHENTYPVLNYKIVGDTVIKTTRRILRLDTLRFKSGDTLWLSEEYRATRTKIDSTTGKEVPVNLIGTVYTLNKFEPDDSYPLRKAEKIVVHSFTIRARHH